MYTLILLSNDNPSDPTLAISGQVIRGDHMVENDASFPMGGGPEEVFEPLLLGCIRCRRPSTQPHQG